MDPRVRSNVNRMVEVETIVALGVAVLSWSLLDLKEKDWKSDFLRCEYFFEMGKITPENRVKVATIHLERRAIQWHHGYVDVHVCGCSWSSNL